MQFQHRHFVVSSKTLLPDVLPVPQLTLTLSRLHVQVHTSMESPNLNDFSGLTPPEDHTEHGPRRGLKRPASPPSTAMFTPAASGSIEVSRRKAYQKKRSHERRREKRVAMARKREEQRTALLAGKHSTTAVGIND
jgi:hypothetical protein